MNDEKGFPGDDKDNAEKDAADERKRSISASRARNKTVMLTPEMTGQVRALLQDSNFSENVESWKVSGSNPLEDFLPPLTDWENAQAGEVERERKTVPGEGGSTGKYGRAEVEELIDAGAPAAERGGDFDPLTSVVPSARAAAGRGFHAAAGASDHDSDVPVKQVQPSFSVNRAAAGSAPRAPVAGGGRAPRSPVETSGGRHSPVSVSGEKTKIVGFLISFDKDKTGEVYEVRAGRWLITSRPTDHGDYILLNDETVSPLHAILRATKEGKIQVLDQLSEHGTAVAKVGEEEETEIAGSLETIGHGDIVRFGQRHFVVCLVPEVRVLVGRAGGKE